jgi:hypothetical protein
MSDDSSVDRDVRLLLVVLTPVETDAIPVEAEVDRETTPL